MPPPFFNPVAPLGVPNTQTRDAGQVNNTVAGSSPAKADRPIGVVAIPAIAATTITDITITNKFASATSYVWLQPSLVGTDTGTTRGPVVWVKTKSNGSFVVSVKTFAAAISANIWELLYLIYN